MKKRTLIFILTCVILFSCNSQNRSDSRNDYNLIAMVMKDGKYGYINPQGEFIIKAQYPLARTFSNGMACVNMGGQRNKFFPGALGGIYAFIDLENNIKFDGKSFSHPTSYDNNFALVHLRNEKKGYINRIGELVIQDFDALGSFKEGLAAAMKKDEQLLGYIDTLGNWKIRFDWKYLIGDFHEGLAYIKEEGKYGYVNKKGEMAIQPAYEEAYDFHEGLACVVLNGKYGFINQSGKIIIPAEYEDVGDFSEGLCGVRQNGKWGYIDTRGQTQIDFQYESVRNFSEGFASVLFEGKVGFISKSGEWKVGPEFENAIDFKNGYAVIQQNGKLGFINIEGEIVIEPQFERVGYFVDPYENNEVIKIN